MGFPKTVIPYDFVDIEVDNEYFKYLSSIQKTSFLGSGFIKRLNRMKGNSSKFLKFHILASKEETIIDFLRKIKIKDQNKIEEALNYSIKLRKFKLIKCLESLTKIKNRIVE